MQELAVTAQLKLETFHAGNPQQLEAAFESMAGREVAALTVLSDVFFTSNSLQIAALSSRHRIPTIAHSREFAIAGGLMSYGTNLTDAYRLAGIYAGRILKGDKPGELPIVEPTRFDFVVNLGAARRLGITIPPILLATADEAIENEPTLPSLVAAPIPVSGCHANQQLAALSY